MVDQPTDPEGSDDQNSPFYQQPPIVIIDEIGENDRHGLMQNIEGVYGPVRIGQLLTRLVEVLGTIGENDQDPRPKVGDL